MTRTRMRGSRPVVVAEEGSPRGIRTMGRTDTTRTGVAAAVEAVEVGRSMAATTAPTLAAAEEEGTVRAMRNTDRKRTAPNKRTQTREVEEEGAPTLAAARILRTRGTVNTAEGMMAAAIRIRMVSEQRSGNSTALYSSSTHSPFTDSLPSTAALTQPTLSHSP